jgi:hypothetical protein
MKEQHIFVETCLYEAVGSLSVMNAFTAPSCSLWEKSAETCLYEAVGSLSVMNAFTAPSCSLWEKSAETCLYEAVGSLSVMNAFTAPSYSLWEKSSLPRLVNVSIRSEKQQHLLGYISD